MAENSNSRKSISGAGCIFALIGFAAAIASELLASGGYELIDWEAAWAGNTTSIIIGIIVAAIIALIVIGMIRGRAVKNAETKQA